MPLSHVRKNASKVSRRETVSKNIKEMVDSWKDSGKIGNTHPRTKKKAVEIAVAAALSTVDRDTHPKKRKK